MPPKKRRPQPRPQRKPKKDPTPQIKRPTPVIDRLKRQDLSRFQILDRMNGQRNQKDLTRMQLRAIGFKPDRIDTIMQRQRQGYPTAVRRTRDDGRGPGGGAYPPDGDGNRGDDGPGLGSAEEDYWTWRQEQEEATLLASQQSAIEIFKQMLRSWGIPVGADIERIIREAAMEGLGPDQIELILPEIQATQSWKDRFPGWHKRVQNGYNQISVGEYLALEDAYHRIMQEAGLPAGFYDQPSDFGNWIANDVSPDEIRDRVELAMGAVRQVDPTARDLLRKFYGVGPGDLASYFLDQKRALPVLERQYKAANVAAFASRAGLKVGDAKRYEDLVDRGVTEEQAAQGYHTVAAFNRAFGRLASIYGEEYTQKDAEEDVFFNRNERRRELLAKEIATFSGRSRGLVGRAARSTDY